MIDINIDIYVDGRQIEDRRLMCKREWDMCGFSHKFIICFLSLFGTFYLLYLFSSALAATSRNWPQPHSPGLGLKILASFNISDTYSKWIIDRRVRVQST